MNNKVFKKNFKNILTGILFIMLPLIPSGTLSQAKPGSYRIYDTNIKWILPKRENTAFTRGEKLTYRVHYGWINAGECELEVKKENTISHGRSTYHVVGTGKTSRLLDRFFKVRDTYESYIDETALVPWVFIRRVNEGGYVINQDQYFNHFDSIVNSNGKKLTIPPGIQDMLSAFYFARSFDLGGLRNGDSFTVETFVDDEIFSLTVVFKGREVITTDIGDVRCLKFNPVIQKGRVFDEEKDLSVWITDDKNKIPARVEAKLFVGAARMDIISYSGLANPLAKE